MTSELIEQVARAFRAEEKLNWNLELGNDDDVADLARIAIAAMQAHTAEQAAELAKYKALAETLAGALPDDIDLFRIIRAAGRSNAAKAQAVYARLSEALRQYKEARDV